METGFNKFVSVILPLKLDWNPIYSAGDEETIHRGARVRVTFAGKTYIGVVASIVGSDDAELKRIDPDRIKSITSVEKGLEDISEQELLLWESVSGYYLCSIGEVYKAAYPASKISQEETQARMNARRAEQMEKAARNIADRIGRLEDRLAKKEEKIRILEEKLQSLEIKSNTAEGKPLRRTAVGKESTILKIEGLKSDCAGLRADIDKYRARLVETEDSTGGIRNNVPDDRIVLSPEQEAARAQIESAFKESKPVLLYGVTGSGKTEIYLKLAAATLSKGKSVLYLVPEIALSRQLEDRIVETMSVELFTFHSGESVAARRMTASAIRNSSGRPYIVLGTRSSLLLPHNNLGLVIVDEEHDSSYKQDSPAPRYNGRDTAIMLASLHNAGIILGSATPSMESLYNTEIGKYAIAMLPDRYYKGDESLTEIIDTIAERKKNGMTGSFSRKLINEIRQRLEKKEQVIVLRGRRSYSPILQCTNCGHIVKCPHCNVSLNYHKNPDRLICHHCGYSGKYISLCPVCGQGLAGIGSGTQKIEEEAIRLFPDARIARLDSDISQKADNETAIIRSFSKGETDILIGTQIVSKGFDFPGLTLVAVIQADSIVGIQDFRADERAFQLLEQFKGRCGRREKRGKFIIQTAQPEHPVYKRIAGGKTADLYASLLDERREFGFPPFRRLINIIIKDIDKQHIESMSWSLSADLRKILAGPNPVTDILGDPVTGPYSPPIDKVGDRHIRIIRICLPKDRQLSANKSKIKSAVAHFERDYKYTGRISIDVDPA